MRHTSLIVLLLTTAAVAAARAETITVDLSGGADYETIREGIDNATSGDTVLVAPGTYNGYRNRELDFGGRAVVLMSGAGPEHTLIDAEVVTRAFCFRSGEDTTAMVVGFEIVNGYADSGAGVFCASASSPKFIDCTFAGNGLAGNTHSGGAVCCLESSPVFVDCRFIGNAAGADGYSSGGAVSVLSNSEPRFEDCSFSENVAGWGGGIYARRSRPVVVGCTFSYNEAYGGGGGMFAGAEATPLVSRSTFLQNDSMDGAGLYSQSSTPLVFECSFDRNAADRRGGGIALLYPSHPVVARCTFVGNTADKGAAAHFEGDIDGSLLDCTAVENSTPTGGGALHCVSASPTLSGCIVAFNDAAALVCEELAHRSAPSMSHCFVFQNTGGDSLCGNHADNRYEDPLFCDTAGGDLTLCSDSACLPENNSWGVPVGSHGEGCGSCGTAVDNTTWGRIKAMYGERAWP